MPDEMTLPRDLAARFDGLPAALERAALRRSGVAPLQRRDAQREHLEDQLLELFESVVPPSAGSNAEQHAASAASQGGPQGPERASTAPTGDLLPGDAGSGLSLASDGSCR